MKEKRDKDLQIFISFRTYWEKRHVSLFYYIGFGKLKL